MGRVTRLAIAMLATMLMGGCAALPSFGTDSGSCAPPPLDPALGPVDGLYVLPDDSRDPVIDEIDRALCSIDLTIFLLSDDATIEALVRAEARGVEVRLLYEPAPFGGGGGIVETTEQLAAAGVEVRSGSTDVTLVHAKYLVIDRQVGIVTNQNLTWSAFESNREIGVVTTEPNDVAIFAAIFAADWDGTAAPVPTGRMLVSPGNARGEMLELIRSAEHSIRLYAEVIRDDEVIDALSTAAQLGVTVQVIANPPDDDLDEVVYATLAANGVDIRYASHLYVHAKAKVIDEREVLVGSHNPTTQSLDRNREISLVITDPVAIARVIATFEADWHQSAITESSPGT